MKLNKQYEILMRESGYFRLECNTCNETIAWIKLKSIDPIKSIECIKCAKKRIDVWINDDISVK